MSERELPCMLFARVLNSPCCLEIIKEAFVTNIYDKDEKLENKQSGAMHLCTKRKKGTGCHEVEHIYLRKGQLYLPNTTLYEERS